MGVTVAAIIGFLIVVIVLARVSSRKPPVPVATKPPSEPTPVPEMVPVSRNGATMNGRDPSIVMPGPQNATPNDSVGWTKRFDPSGTSLDEHARLALLGDLAVVRAPWAMLLVQQAYGEERSLSLRRAALRALVSYRHADARATFEDALESDDAELRAIALIGIDALDERSTDST